MASSPASGAPAPGPLPNKRDQGIVGSDLTVIYHSDLVNCAIVPRGNRYINGGSFRAGTLIAFNPPPSLLEHYPGLLSTAGDEMAGFPLVLSMFNVEAKYATLAEDWEGNTIVARVCPNKLSFRGISLDGWEGDQNQASALNDPESNALDGAELPDTWFVDASVRDQVGPSPAVRDVLPILTEAIHCEATDQDEAGWNTCVHFPLLRLAIHGANLRRSASLVDVEPCVTASILSEYHRLAVSAPKRVDFALVLRPKATGDHTAAARIDELRQCLPSASINHTDFGPLRRAPIALSIETKRLGESAIAGNVQVGVWHAAQWRLLERLAQQHSRRLGSLPFLPAIVVVGHQWSLSVTTQDGPKTILWHGFPLGSTHDVVRIYRLVYVLQLLTRWCNDVYWPWYRENALALDGAA